MTPEQLAARMVQVGQVVQITDGPPESKGWLGAFVLVTEVKTWGIQGFVHVIETHETAGFAYIRLAWDRFEVIGTAVMVPADLDKEDG